MWIPEIVVGVSLAGIGGVNIVECCGIDVVVMGWEEGEYTAETEGFDFAGEVGGDYGERPVVAFGGVFLRVEDAVLRRSEEESCCEV